MNTLIRSEEQRSREPKQHQGSGFEWPTVAVAASIYAGFAVLTWQYHALPWWVVVPVGGYLIAWHGSLQHETVHGHPTRWAWVNELIVFPSLWLWIPYRRYRAMHLRHHVTNLTDPVDDPESFYLTPYAWARAGPLMRTILWIHNTSAGRLLLGPCCALVRLLVTDGQRLARGDTTVFAAWLLHGVACACVLTWVMWICQIALLDYLALFVYPGLSLTLLRSFLEHRASTEPGHQTVIVEASPVMSLLYLYNNLHALHHAAPSLPWYQLAGDYREHRAALLTYNDGYFYRGYGAVIARHLLHPKEPVAHPQWRESMVGR